MQTYFFKPKLDKPGALSECVLEITHFTINPLLLTNTNVPMIALHNDKKESGEKLPEQRLQV